MVNELLVGPAQCRWLAEMTKLPEARFLASNTSSVPIMKLGADTSQPHRVLGLHFFNPVPVLPLVEIVQSIMTTPDTVESARQKIQKRLGSGGKS